MRLLWLAICDSPSFDLASRHSIGKCRSRSYRSSGSSSSSMRQIANNNNNSVKLFTVCASKCIHKMQNSIAALAITHLFNCSFTHAHIGRPPQTHIHTHSFAFACVTVASFICALIECRQFVFEYLLLGLHLLFHSLFALLELVEFAVVVLVVARQKSNPTGSCTFSLSLSLSFAYSLPAILIILCFFSWLCASWCCHLQLFRN